MKSMREMIKLMEGVVAVPGLNEDESDMQTAGTIGRNNSYAAFDAAQPAVDEAREPMYHSVFFLDPTSGRWAHQTDADDFIDADDEKYSLTNQGVKAIILKVPKSQADWTRVDVDQFVKDQLAGKVKAEEAIELHPDQDLGTEQGWFIVAQDGMIASGPFESLGEAQRHAHFMEWYKRNPELYSFENGIRDEAGMFVDLEGNEMKEAHVDTCRQTNQAPARQACAMEEDFDLNNGYGSEQYASGQDYFPNGADGPVVKKVGPSGARQGDNPEQKKMAIAELHKELVYGYRKYLKESAK